MIRRDRSDKLAEDVEGEPDEPKRSVAPRKRGLGRGLGAILSAPANSAAHEGHDEHLTLHDPLTGLPNRTLLDDRLEEALATCRRDGASLAVLVVSLDGFSKVNELFGHRVGDDLLHDVADRMSSTRRKSDTVARFAGDEFVVVCPYVGSTELACRMAARILEDVGRPVSVEGVEHRLSASIGVVVAEPGEAGDEDDREGLEALLGDAALAMRQAKDEGGGSWRLFDAAMREDATARYQYRQDLRAAMEDGGLFLEYEPIVDLGTGAVVGLSALLGWRLPGSVVEGPEALLELVDEAGLAVPVGCWVLDEALSHLSARRTRDVLPEDFRVWVKLSPSFVADPTLVESIDELTAKHRIPSSMIGLDIAEPSPTALAAVESTLQALVVRDVALALDEFGARASNPTLLQRLPIGALKLATEVVAALVDTDGENEGEFDGVDGAEAQEAGALVKGLVDLGRALGLDVVAQGVESAAQVAALRVAGCEFAQGPFEGLEALDTFEGPETPVAPETPEPLWATGHEAPASPWASDDPGELGSLFRS